MPVIIGIVVGIAVILTVFLVLPIFSSHGGLNNPPQYSLSISGLSDTYNVGQKIDFQVTLKGKNCVYPDYVMVKTMQIHSGSGVIWLFNGTTLNLRMLCPYNDPTASTTYSTDMGVWNGQWTKSPIIINETGKYSVEASFGNDYAEKEFSVVK